MLFRLCPEPRDNEPGLVLLSRPAVGGEEIIRLCRNGQPHDPGKALSIRTGTSIFRQILGCGAAQMLIQGVLIAGILILLHPHVDAPEAASWARARNSGTSMYMLMLFT